MEQIQYEKDSGEPKCDHCDCTVELSNANRTVFAALDEYETNKHKNLFDKNKQTTKQPNVNTSFFFFFSYNF